MTTDDMTSRLLRPIWCCPEFLRLKFSVLYDQILYNMTNIFEIWSTHYQSIEKFDTFAGQIRSFSKKIINYISETLPSFAPKTN